jgi:hypothetical protein
MQRDTKRCSGALGALRRAAGQRKLRRNTRGRRKVFKNMGGGAPRGFAGHQEVQRATETCSRTAKATPKHQRPPKGFQKHREGAPRGSAGHQTVQRATERRSGHREVFRCTGCTGTYSGTVKATPERPPKGDPKHQGAPRGSAGHYTASHQQAVQRATNNGCSRLPRGVTMHWKHQNAKQDSESRNGAPEAAERVP